MSGYRKWIFSQGPGLNIKSRIFKKFFFEVTIIFLGDLFEKNGWFIIGMLLGNIHAPDKFFPFDLQ